MESTKLNHICHIIHTVGLLVWFADDTDGYQQILYQQTFSVFCFILLFLQLFFFFLSLWTIAVVCSPSDPLYFDADSSHQSIQALSMPCTSLYVGDIVLVDVAYVFWLPPNERSKR